MMDPQEVKRFEDLENEVAELRSELEHLQEFIKSLYSLMREGTPYDGTGELPGEVDFREIDT